MSSCEICSILASHNEGKDIEVIQTKKWRVVLDPNQQFLGKAFVTLLEHKSTLSELTQEDWDDFRLLVARLESSMRSAFQPSHFNWSCLMNLAAMSGQDTHVHWHLHPRYKNAVVVDNETFEDTKWYPREEKRDHVVSKVALRKIANKIQVYI